MEEFIQNLNNYFTNEGVTLVKSITIVLIGFLLIKGFIKILRYSLIKTGVKEKTLANFVISLINVALILVLVIYALTLAGVSAESVVTIASVFSLGLSLALQDTIASFANGIIIIISKPFVEGEYVEVNGIGGTITSISMFHTTLTTPAGQMITVPNSSVTTSNVINYSRYPTRRLDMEIPVSYNSKTEHVKKVVMEVVNKQPGILNSPAPSIRLTSYGDSNLNYTLKVWVTCDIYWDTVFDLNEKVLDALIDAGINIDYTKYDVNINNFPTKEEKGE